MAVLLNLPASLVAKAHTTLAVSAFAVALGLGYFAGLWKALCENAVAGWPVEWFPSVSATIGDHAPSRAPFHLLIALTATPRFLLLALQWMVHRYPPGLPSPFSTADTSASSSQKEERELRARNRVMKKESSPTLEMEDGKPAASIAPDWEFFTGVARTLSCGMWMFVTSRDQHDIHDAFMIIYIILNLPWMILSTINSTNQRTRVWRLTAATGFIVSIGPLLWLYYRHSTLRIPGAYTYYSMVEWSLVFWDIFFDAAAVTELGHLKLHIVDESRRDIGKSGGRIFAPRAAQVVRDNLDWTDGAKEVAPATTARAVVAYLSDVWFAVTFWTLFTSLSVQLFYWSVWKLALSGSELALFANLAPFALVTSYRRFAVSRSGLFTHRAILFTGLASFAIPSVTTRLLISFCAVWAGWNAVVGDLLRMRGSREVIVEAKVLLLGLVVTMLLKHLNHSNNPFWPVVDGSSGGLNLIGLGLSTAALFEYRDRPLDLFPSRPLPTTATRPLPTTTTRPRRLLIAIGLGALIHLIQTFATDAGTIIAWTWTGFPITGPTPHPFAGVVIAVASVSLLASNNTLWSLFGCGSAYTLYTFPDWTGFVGGVGLVAYILATFPSFIQAASMCSPSTIGLALLINCFLDVASVFTVAYAFVPFGWILRERTDLVLGFCMLAVSLASVFGVATLQYQPTLKPRSTGRLVRNSRYITYTSLLIAIFSIATSFTKVTPTITPYFPDHKIFTGGIWTVHFGIDEQGRDSQRRMAELVEEMQVDVLGLLETDLHRFVYGNRDLTRYIAEELGYYVDLGPGPNKHTWGAALLSKFPILNSTHHLLPSPAGELAPAIFATLDVHGSHVNVLVSHNGQEEDARDRELQTRELARLLRGTIDTPTIFLGYLVTHVGDKAPAPYQILFEDGGMIDIEKEDRWRWCEYMGFRGLWRIGFARIDHGDLTDTELQVGKFMLPLPDAPVHYNDDVELYWHIGEDDVPPPWRMTRKYRDQGVNGHFYRVWDGPLYYLPPEHSKLREYGWD